MEFNIADRTIFITLHGSHAYGMSREGSDVDIKGIAIPPVEYFHGFLRNFEQFEAEYPRDDRIGDVTFVETIEKMVGREVPKDEKIDSVIYGLRKFLFLAAKCNPNIIEILFTDPKCHVFTTQLSDILMENRDLFLSQKANYTFCGFAHAQLKRIKTHRAWLLNPPKKKPERKDFNLPQHSLMPRDHRMAAEGLIKKKIQEWILIPDELPRDVLESVRENTVKAFRDIWEGLVSSSYIFTGDAYEYLYPPVTENGEWDLRNLSYAAGKKLGYEDNFLMLLDRERRYKGALRNYKQYQEWKTNRNPVRAKMEKDFGFDGKHGSHLVRLLRMAREILIDGEVRVCRSDAEELLSIRRGEWSYDRLIEFSDQTRKEIDEICKNNRSVLPKTPNSKKIDNLCQRLVEKALSEGVR